NQILEDFKNKKRDSADFWINMGGRLIYIRYFAVRNKNGEYLGCLEVTQDITEIQKITGEKRLL
ncbi:MAG: PAS domain-containing protein, partial [candidate division WOR-3 bacterium]